MKSRFLSVFSFCLVTVSLFCIAPVRAGESPYGGGGSYTGSGGFGSQIPSSSPTGTTDDQGTCASLKPGGTDASVDLIVTEPSFDSSSTLANLKSQGGNARQNWIAANKLTELWSVDDTDTAGLAYGGVKTDFDVGMTSASVDQYGVYYCSFFSRIHVKVEYATRVMIPSKFEPGSCAYQVVKIHEQMLIDANRKAMESYVDRLRADLPGIVDELEKGFSSKDNLQRHEELKKADLYQAIDLYIKETVVGKMRQMALVVNTPQELKLRMTAMQQCGER